MAIEHKVAQSYVGKQARWVEDQARFDETGEATEWRSANPLVPAGYLLDLGFNCLTNAENLALLSPGLHYVEGQARLRSGDTSWGDHAWCETAKGEVVDPYFEWKFPDQHIVYRAGEFRR
jgi:hypothetical protein